MDGRQLDFPADHFDLVLARASLHHVRDWQLVVDEMLRVAAGGVLIEEPLDDPRSDAKRNTMRAQRLFLELHSEVGYSHYAYITSDELTNHLRTKGVRIESEITRLDGPVTFDYYFEPWGFFADKSSRKEYWLQRLSDYRRELGDGQLCENDILFVAVHK
jgi:SAM-dependent methyltransferase